MHSERQQRNIKVFNDTKRLYANLLLLRDAIVDSMTKQKLYIGEKFYDFSKTHYAKRETEVIVSGKRSLEAAMPYVKMEKKYVF